MLSSHLSSVTILMPHVKKSFVSWYSAAAVQSLGSGTASVSERPSFTPIRHRLASEPAADSIPLLGQ